MVNDSAGIFTDLDKNSADLDQQIIKVEEYLGKAMTAEVNTDRMFNEANDQFKDDAAELLRLKTESQKEF